jgi:hypothetical protein
VGVDPGAFGLAEEPVAGVLRKPADLPARHERRAGEQDADPDGEERRGAAGHEHERRHRDGDAEHPQRPEGVRAPALDGLLERDRHEGVGGCLENREALHRQQQRRHRDGQRQQRRPGLRPRRAPLQPQRQREHKRRQHGDEVALGQVADELRGEDPDLHGEPDGERQRDRHEGPLGRPLQPPRERLDNERAEGEQRNPEAEEEDVGQVPRDVLRRLAGVVPARRGLVGAEDAAERPGRGPPDEPGQGQARERQAGWQPAPEPRRVAREAGVEQDSGDCDGNEDDALQARRHDGDDRHAEQRLAAERGELERARERPGRERGERQEQHLGHREAGVRERRRRQRQRGRGKRPAAGEERPPPRVDDHPGQRDDDGLEDLQQAEADRELVQREGQPCERGVEEAVVARVRAEDRKRPVRPEGAPEQRVDHLVGRDERTWDPV